MFPELNGSFTAATINVARLACYPEVTGAELLLGVTGVKINLDVAQCR